MRFTRITTAGAGTMGSQVAWQMARGYEGQFGHLVNAGYVWIPLALIFFFGLFDFARKRKMVHLDLLVLLSFGISQFFFDRGEIGISVPLAYPPLIYLLCRVLWIGFKGQRDGLRPSVPLTWLAIATMFLNMSLRLPATVISCTGWEISPFSTQNPAAPRE